MSGRRSGPGGAGPAARARWPRSPAFARGNLGCRLLAGAAFFGWVLTGPGAGVAAAAQAGDEEPPAPVRPAEKLPVDLPELKVIGHEPRPDVSTGSKLPLEASASVTALPPPPPARATSELLDRLRLPVPPPPEPALPADTAADRNPYTSLWGGLGALRLADPLSGSFDLGLYHGQRIGPALSITDLTLDAHGLDRWSSLRLGQQLAWSDRGWARLGYRREEQWPGAALALQEGLQGEAGWSRDSLALRAGGEAGKVEARGVAGEGVTNLFEVSARGDFTPDLWFLDHQPRVGLGIGLGGAEGPGQAGWLSPLLALEAGDRFRLQDALTLDAGLGLSFVRQAPYLDPGVRLEYRPPGPDPEASPTEAWVAARTETRLPGFGELYQSRQRTVGNAGLRPQRTEPRLEVGLGHRLTDRAYASGAVAVSRAQDWIYFGPAGAGLWQPRNHGGWQNVYDLEFQSQYLWSDLSLQRFDVRLRNPEGLGERFFSAGTRHDSSWLDGKLALAAGSSVDYVELGQSQGGGRGVDWRADWEVGYRIAPGWLLYLAGKDWHVWQQEPAAGYFSTPQLITAGVKLDF